MSDTLLVSLLLHKLGPPQYPGDVYSLPPEWLHRLVDQAAARACGFTHWNRLLSDPPGDRHVLVALTFDDGFESDVSQVLPFLQARAIPATFFITPGFIGQPGYLRWSQVRALADAGMAIGSHSLTHASLSTLSTRDLRRELVVSRHLLEDATGAPVTLLSVPGGFYSRRVLETAWEIGYTVVGTSDWGIDRLSGAQPGERWVLKRNGVDRRTAWRVIAGLLQARIPWRVLARERSKRFLSRRLPSWYEKLSDAWRRRVFVYHR